MHASREASDGPVRRLGSYTTARVTRGRVERLERHVARLRRDATRLGLPVPARADIERVFLEAAHEAFGRGDGIVRVEWSRPEHRPDEAPRLTPAPRPFHPLPETWRAITSSVVHPGPELRANTKYVDVSAYTEGREEVAAGDFEEVLLFDAQGRLVEGSHSNFVVVLEDGRIVTPALSLGGVEGLGLGLVREGALSVAEAEIDRAAVSRAQALLSVNAVRGVVPIATLDGVALGTPAGRDQADRIGAAFGARVERA